MIEHIFLPEVLGLFILLWCMGYLQSLLQFSGLLNLCLRKKWLFLLVCDHFSWLPVGFLEMDGSFLVFNIDYVKKFGLYCMKSLSEDSNSFGVAGNMLTFLVGSKLAFEVSLADVSQTQLQGKNDVVLEFHVDDTTGANEVSIAYCTCQPASPPKLFSFVGGFQLCSSC